MFLLKMKNEAQAVADSELSGIAPQQAPVAESKSSNDVCKWLYSPVLDDTEEETSIANPNLKPGDLRSIEKIQAKIQHHKMRNEVEEVDRLRAQIELIEANANMKVVKQRWANSAQSLW